MVEIVDFDVAETTIEGLVFLCMKQVTDDRGTVREFYRESAFVDAGLPSLGRWVQVNVTETRKGAIRGMHGEQMHKLVAVASGRGFGAYVDVRPDSPSVGTVATLDLTPGVQVLVPPGVCNGFQSCSEAMQYAYCFDQEWQPDMDGVAVTPLDPALGIRWPEPFDIDDPAMVSGKDRGAPTLAELLGDRR